MIEKLGGIVSNNGDFVSFYGERDKIKYDEVLNFCLKHTSDMEPNKVYESGIGKYFITKGKVCI